MEIYATCAVGLGLINVIFFLNFLIFLLVFPTGGVSMSKIGVMAKVMQPVDRDFLSSLFSTQLRSQGLKSPLPIRDVRIHITRAVF